MRLLFDVGSVEGDLLGILSIWAIVAVMLITLLFYAYYAFVLAKLFQKAGKPAWAAIVPVYNIIVLLEIIGYKWYYVFVFLFSFVPYIGSVIILLFKITLGLKLSKAYGQSVGFGIGLALVPIIFLSIFAFNNKINYIGPSVNGDIDFNDLF